MLGAYLSIHQHPYFYLIDLCKIGFCLYIIFPMARRSVTGGTSFPFHVSGGGFSEAFYGVGWAGREVMSQ